MHHHGDVRRHHLELPPRRIISVAVSRAVSLSRSLVLLAYSFLTEVAHPRFTGYNLFFLPSSAAIKATTPSEKSRLLGCTRYERPLGDLH